MNSDRIVVIGGGLGGLCTAALLARGGKRVLLLEQASALGARARSKSELGYVHNLGAHALYQGASAEQVLAALGVRAEGGLVRGAGAYLLQDDLLHPMPSGLGSMLTSAALGLRGKLQVGRLLASLGEGKARALDALSVREWLERELSDPRARALVSMLVRLTCYAHAPDYLSAAVAVRQLAHAQRDGVRYVHGGWQSLVDAVQACAVGAGVEIMQGVRAASVEHAGMVRGVLLADGRRLAASAVVTAVDPRGLASLVPADASLQRAADAAVPVRAACLDLGVQRVPHPERKVVLSTMAPLYFSNHSAFATLAPPQACVLHLVRYLEPGEDGREHEAELRAFLERIQPGVQAAAVIARFMPNLTVHNAVPGSSRLGCEHPELRGLYMVGDYIDSGRHAMLLDAVLASAQQVAERLTARDATQVA